MLYQVDPPASAETKADDALLALLHTLRERGYDFVTITPASHQRVLDQPGRTEARDLRDVLGWSLPFAPSVLDDELIRLLQQGDLIQPAGEGLARATVRVSRLGDDLYLHSAYPTLNEDAVFFGPDSYRFAHLIERELDRIDHGRIATAIDIGTGAGVGAIVMKHRLPGARVIGTDINPKALRLAAVNAAGAATKIELRQGADIPVDPVDLAVANPPYIIDAEGRSYRDGGDGHGAQIAIDMVAAALPRLSGHGTMILYTGSAIVGGADALHGELTRLAAQHRRTLRYEMLDPDVFGEELAKAPYREVERIALVAAVFGPRINE